MWNLNPMVNTQQQETSLPDKKLVSKEYVTAAKSFPPTKLEQIISILRESDARAKGVGSVSMDEGDILKEMVYKILH